MFMKKLIFIFLALIVLTTLLPAQSVGGGISFFLPETLYLDGDGTIGFEQGLSTAIGIGSLFSIPLGFAYHSSDGYRLEDTGLATITGPALYGDLIMPYLQLKIRVPIGPVYIEGWGGGAFGWAFSLKPTGNFANLFGSDIAVGDTNIQKKLGYGWMAGGAIGVQINAIGIDLGATYRAMFMPISGSVSYSGSASGTHTFTDQAKAILRGISFRIGGSFSF